MRRAIGLVVLGLASSAFAQPGQAPPPPMQPQPWQPQPYGYSAQPPPMQAQLTLDEQYLLDRGYISDSQRIRGGVASLFFGLGLGQAVQGRWTETGWIFTLGEGVTAGMFIW